ncbi:hypothetical protein [Methyloceanibacter stevinii]|nr:hypothetical protein [Methyloceanibacter stevinii]
MAGSFQSRLRLILGFAFAAGGGLALSAGAQAAPGARDAAIVVAATTIAEVADETQSPEVPAAEGAPDAATHPETDASTAKAESESAAASTSTACRRICSRDCAPRTGRA